MKNIFFITCMFTAITFTGCVDDDDDLLSGEISSGVEILPENKPNDVVEPKLFDIINLDYPGLEKVKSFYEAGEHYYAAHALLEYYRTRTNVTNPGLSLVNVTITDADQAKADYALEDYRFHVNNFFEDANALKPYSIKKDDKINWEYSPEGASDEYQKQLHRHQWFIPQGKAYRASGDEKYIESWIATYTDWILQNPKPETGTNTTSWWQLQVASRLNDQVELFEYFKHSNNFTPEWLSTFIVSFAEQADFLVDYPYTKGGNILVTQAKALATAGTLMPELKNAEVWINTGYQTLAQEVKSQFLNDGWHKEMSLCYHISTVNNFYEIMRVADANHLSEKLPADFIEPLRKATEVLMYFTYPNYFQKGSDNIVPMFNDSWSRTRSIINNNFKNYVEMFSDSEELKYMATAVNGNTPQGKTPNNDMKLFDQAGYYVLRNGWTPASTVMIFSNNKSNDLSAVLSSWTHNQADNGTFELYRNGRNFFPDSGVCTYYTTGGDNSLRNWFRGIDKHNTLSLNKKNITKADGKLLKSEKGNTELIVFENQGYNNLKHRRAVFYIKDKDLIVLVDEGIGTAEGTINLSFNLCEGSNTEVVMDTQENGVHTAFKDNNNILVRTFANKEITCSPFTGRISYEVKGEYKERQSYTIDMTKAADETARYITVIYPNNDVNSLSAQFTDNGYSENGAAIKVVINGIEYSLSYTL